MKNLEKELRSLKPSSPSLDFETGLEEALGEPGKVAVKQMPEMLTEQVPSSPGGLGTITSSGFFRFALFSGITIALAVALYLSNPASSDKVAVYKPPSLGPVTEQAPNPQSVGEQDSSPLHGVSNASISEKGWETPEKRAILVDSAVEGIVDRPGQAPARRYRYRFLDETIWRHPATNTFIQSAIPREEVVLVGLDPY